MADESCVVEEDLDRLVGVVAAVNVKLAKCGGPGPAARMIRRASALVSSPDTTPHTIPFNTSRRVGT